MMNSYIKNSKLIIDYINAFSLFKPIIILF
ncbi:hypothetical protein KOSB73_220088 [Klebsiella grimontii]|uniref:Uncharacterized protein n=1 Tax=Klebsiella grimontii TaxID=2058152 RepID=A0A285AZ30_9ENTR|nr:hypothetical protein KOSB73_220088 [Klebsiella grimontii]